MAQIREVEIYGLEGSATQNDATYESIRNLLRHTERMLPGSRAFGMNDEYIDSNPEDLQNDFATDLYEKVDRFVPTVNVVDIGFDDLGGGAYKVRIQIEERGTG